MGKSFGMSSNLKTFCTICGAGKKTSFLILIGGFKNGILMVIFGALAGTYLYGVLKNKLPY